MMFQISFNILIVCLIDFAGCLPALDAKGTQQQDVFVNDDFEVMFEYGIAQLNVLNNDYGFDDGVQSLKIVTHPKHGTARVVDRSYIEYSPSLGFVGEDQLTYEVCSANGACGKGIVDIMVLDYDFAPIAINDSVLLVNNRDTLIDVLHNDIGYFDSPWVVHVIQEPKYGKAAVDGNQHVRYQPDSGFSRIDSFQYRICDKDNECDIAWVFLINGGSNNNDGFFKLGFSPNGDGINDVLFIKTLNGNKKLSFLVYDRSGAVVFEDANYSNSWDGYSNRGVHKGKLLPVGTYLFQMEAQGFKKPIQGYIYINY